MPPTNPSDERSTDTANRIARERLADDLDPCEFGDADSLADVLAGVAADLRSDSLSPADLTDALTHLRNVRDALQDVSELHGWGWEEHATLEERGRDRDDGADTTADRVDDILAEHDVERDGTGATEISVSDAVFTHVYDDEPATVTIDLWALDAEQHDATDRVTLSPGAAAQLRQDLEAALKARLAETQRYDREGDDQ